MSKRLWWILLASLLVLMTACIVLSWNTREAMMALPFLHKSKDPLSAATSQKTVVDLQPWQTAEVLATMAASAEESEQAHEAEHLADHEVDQAFAAALREASLDHRALTGEAADLAKKVARLQSLVEGDQVTVRNLTAHDPDDDLDVAKAQLGLDTDQLTEAQQDLTRAGGDQRGLIQEELAAHENAMKKYDAEVAGQKPPAVNAAETSATLAAEISAWFAQDNRHDLLLSAAQQTRQAAATVLAKHKALEESSTAASAQEATGDKNSRLNALSAQSTRSQLLGIYDDRNDTLRQLAATYDKWAAQVVLQHRMTGHLILQSLGLIAFILICVMLCDELALYLARRPALDPRRMKTLATILKLTIESIGAVLVLLVIFGKPNQLPTILGLATAGLTVALQDFIIAFFGWFALMGGGGIRVGDWVEINGVTGEIVNIGLFRTSMLETGNSVDKGRPTGRRTSFINSYAIKGQYFNFSTAGQWMWDEIRVGVPAGREAREVIEQVRTRVVVDTAENSRQAAQEWKQVSEHFSTDPAVDMRPAGTGIDLVVRYVTRASDRFETRNKLYHDILGLLHETGDTANTAAH